MVRIEPASGLRCPPDLFAFSRLDVAVATAYLVEPSDARERTRPMHMAPMRYTKIDGTAVAVSVKSATEAKAAVKELRHKKRELKFQRAELVKRQRALRSRQGAKRRRRAGDTSAMSSAINGIGGLIGGLFDHATLSAEERRDRDPAHIEREIRRIDETLHNIDGCILQLQGKLLTLG
jgi:hypothetical protein